MYVWVGIMGHQFARAVANLDKPNAHRIEQLADRGFNRLRGTEPAVFDTHWLVLITPPPDRVVHASPPPDSLQVISIG